MSPDMFNGIFTGLIAFGIFIGILLCGAIYGIYKLIEYLLAHLTWVSQILRAGRDFKEKEVRKLIFLDIDGVLAIPNKNRRIWAIDDTKQELLKEILDSTGAEIVLSSSWRWHTVEKTREKMQSQGFRFSDRITGVTIRAYQYVDKQSKIHLSIPRGVEIKQWIDTNIHSENGKNWDRKDFGKDFTYVILDDDSDMLLEQKKQFINTNSLKGLNKRHAEKAIRILNAQK